MKGILFLFLAIFMMSFAQAASIRPADLIALKLRSNEIIKNLSLQESTKVLKSLDKDENIEIRSRVIYPEEITQLITRQLTKGRISGKKPNPEDYN